MVLVRPRLSLPAERSSAASDRLLGFDAWRAIAAYAVIWIHVPRSEALVWTTILCRFAVPFFIAGAAYFAARGAWQTPSRSWSAYAWSRIARIYVPFLIWSAIYLGFKYAKWLLLPAQDNAFPGLEILWTGAAYHLWFMPFVLVVCLLSFTAARGFDSVLPRARVAAAWGCLLSAVTLGWIIQLIGPAATPLGFMIQAIPAALFGLELAFRSSMRPLTAHGTSKPQALNRATHDLAATRPRHVYLPMMLSGLLFPACQIVLLFGGRDVIVESLAGAFLLRAALASGHFPIDRIFSALGRLSAGIYFAHLLIIKSLESVTTCLHWETTPQIDVGIFILTAICSTLLAWLLSRAKLTRWLVT